MCRWHVRGSVCVCVSYHRSVANLPRHVCKTRGDKCEMRPETWSSGLTRAIILLVDEGLISRVYPIHQLNRRQHHKKRCVCLGVCLARGGNRGSTRSHWNYVRTGLMACPGRSCTARVIGVVGSSTFVTISLCATDPPWINWILCDCVTGGNWWTSDAGFGVRFIFDIQLM